MNGKTESRLANASVTLEVADATGAVVWTDEFPNPLTLNLIHFAGQLEAALRDMDDYDVVLRVKHRSEVAE